MKDFNQQEFNLLRKISKKHESSQRELASKMDVSLGKLNYLLNELKLKGLIKIKNFKRHPNKTGYLYLLTPRGIAEKTKITLNFMKRKLQEYDELKKEVEIINKKQKRRK